MKTLHIEGVEFEVGSRIIRLTEDEQRSFERVSKPVEQNERWVWRIFLVGLPSAAGLALGGLVLSMSSPSYAQAVEVLAMISMVVLFVSLLLLGIREAFLKKRKAATENEITGHHGVLEGEEYIIA